MNVRKNERYDGAQNDRNYLSTRCATQNSEFNGGDQPSIQKTNDAYSILSIKQYVICARLIFQNIIMRPSLM